MIIDERIITFAYKYFYNIVKFVWDIVKGQIEAKKTKNAHTR